MNPHDIHGVARSRSTPTREEVHTFAGPYALDAIDDIERAEFARHLAQCPACAQEIAELRATASRLADVVAAPPPPALRAAVLAEIGRTRQLGPRSSPEPRAGQPRWRRLAVAAAAVAVVAAGAGVTTYTVEEQRVREARAVAAVLDAKDLQVRTVDAAGGGQVKILYSRAMNEGLASLSGLPAPAAGHTYQLWFLRGNAAVNVGVLDSGTGRHLLTDLHGATSFAVSNERSTSPVKSPTLPPVESVPMD